MLLCAAGGLSTPAHGEVSFSFFYSNLSPHGTWHVSADYGQVWQPHVYAADWNPYYDGHWVYSDCGWAWVSDYRWGAVPYHYGTWVPDPVFGWVWVPGYVWAPSWVVFRTGPDYIGWAPVSPHFSIGATYGYGPPAASFVFVNTSHFLAPRVRTYAVPRGRAYGIINNTTVVNNLVIERNVVVNRGPDVRTIERAHGRKVRQVPIEQVARVAPNPRVRREDLAVEPRRMAQGIRVAEPKVDPIPERSERMSRAQREGRGAPLASTSRGAAPQRDARPKAVPRGQREITDRQEVGRARPDRSRSNADVAARPGRSEAAPQASRRPETPEGPSVSKPQGQAPAGTAGRQRSDRGREKPKPHPKTPEEKPGS
jgi:hypothetical protein